MSVPAEKLADVDIEAASRVLMPAKFLDASKTTASLAVAVPIAADRSR